MLKRSLVLGVWATRHPYERIDRMAMSMDVTNVAGETEHCQHSWSKEINYYNRGVGSKKINCSGATPYNPSNGAYILNQS
tara:strand:+ start:1247 stop:1486 length:240 start_codon:yes stop_codon:yes gene_type:complete